MQISILDASNYFKGLLLLIRKDRTLSDPEVTMMRRIGKTLGFEKEFTDNAISDILENEYIVDAPPVFAQRALAEKFLKDGLAIACSDRECHPSEEAWLRSTAVVNGVEETWFAEALAFAKSHQHEPPKIEADGIVVQYS